MKKLVFLAVLLVFVGSACAADTTTGLVGWWKMNEGSGSQLLDSSGNGNNGNIGSKDTWIAGGGLNFDGGAWGESGIGFNNAELIPDLNLGSQVTVSYKAQWDSLTGAGYTYQGLDSAGTRVLSSECPTGTHMLNHFGGTNEWAWEAFNDQDSRFIYSKNGVNKTWGDWITITQTVNFETGDYMVYVDGILYTSATGKTGTFTGLKSFTIGRNDFGGTSANMADFRIYNRALTADDVAALVPEPATLALLGLGSLALIRSKKN